MSSKFTPTSLPAGFVRWWAAYPRKVSKGSAVKAWHRNGCEELADEIIKATKSYPFSEEIQYVKHPSTWLNGWCWMDSVEGIANDDW